MAQLSAQSPRSHRGHGLLHGAHDHLRWALLLLYHWPRSAAHSPFQRDPPSNRRLDRAANGAKPFPTNGRPSFSSWITTPSTAPKCPSRTAGSRDCHQRVASEAAPLFLGRVLPPGSDPLRTKEADSGKANALLRPREGGGVASGRRSSSSLRTRCLNC